MMRMSAIVRFSFERCIAVRRFGMAMAPNAMNIAASTYFMLSGTPASAAKFLDVPPLLLGRPPRSAVAIDPHGLARGGRGALIEVHRAPRFLRLLRRRHGLHHDAA